MAESDNMYDVPSRWQRSTVIFEWLGGRPGGLTGGYILGLLG